MYQGYYTDFARTILIGKPNREQKRIYSAAYNSLHAAISAVSPGVPSSLLDEKVKKVIVESDCSDMSFGLIGHGVGVTAQEPPYFVTKELQKAGASASENILREGMVFALSVGVFAPELGGVRFEEVVVVTSNGRKVLSRAPYPEIEKYIN